MHLIPTNEEVIALLRETGALRDGHFEYPGGMHANEYLQVALAFRYFQNAKILSIGLSRRLRADPELRAMINELSIVCPNTGGLPIAYGLCEALRAPQVYWADQDGEGTPMRFRQYLEQLPGEKVLLVDDLLRSGIRLTQLKKLVESNGATVVGLAVAVYQPNPSVADFGSLPLFYLAKMNATYYRDSSSCELCNRGVPVEKIWV
ncbi:MAG TPA: phosphoribosyltransferase family protein [Bryobacteraceae bacterium]|jgi:orotate phosphoribosyltransferase|nr:phosphoribosyltransferase family protein [Bryobacteraceae bacterium]